MQPSEMTNNELANELEKPLVGSRIVIEAAARLRNATVREMAHRASVEAYRREVKDLNSKRHATICDLRRRLKVVEDALEKCVNYNNAWELEAAEEYAKNALAAIRGEGEEDDK